MTKTERFEIYKCNICGNIIEVEFGGGGNLVCCSQVMENLEAKTRKLEGNEKHVPIVELNGHNVTVKVGSIPHPMEEKHHICMIELLKGNKIIASASLMAGDKPEASFTIKDSKGIKAREICNVHGLWIS